jgi:hypothetical protein
MVWRELGLSRTSNLNSVIGFTDTETVLLDFDSVSFRTVRYWARRAVKWFKLGGFIILKSSESCYHVVFDQKVTWSENMKITAWVSLLSQNKGLNKYLVMQCIKEASTLRVSPKYEKPSPRIVYREGNQDQQIREFLVQRDLIKKIVRSIIGTS